MKHTLIFILISGLLISSCKKDSTGELITLDYDGNVYHTVVIGTQTWMIENLHTTHYRNGDPIPYITDSSAWTDATEGAYSYYNNDASIGNVYGKLYNGFAVKDSRGLAPAGWHIPSSEEIQTLVNFLGGTVFAGGKLKEADTTHWYAPNQYVSSNGSGFTALPGGYNGGRVYGFGDLHISGYFWTSTPQTADLLWVLGMDYNAEDVYVYNDDNYVGYSVRCIKDE